MISKSSYSRKKECTHTYKTIKIYIVNGPSSLNSFSEVQEKAYDWYQQGVLVSGIEENT